MPASQRNITVADCIESVMKRLGLDFPGTVVGNSDKTTMQLLEILNDCGQELLDHDWQILSRDQTLTTVIGQATYDLPTDLNKYIQDADWNRTTRLPVVGALREDEWQMLKARQLAGTTFTMLFRISEDQLEFYDTPSTEQTIVLPYQSRNWLRKNDDTGTDHVEADDDTILYDSQLIKAFVTLRFYQDKGFDTVGKSMEYTRALSAAKAKDVPGRTLSLSQRASYPYLGVLNIPDTGYGS